LFTEVMPVYLACYVPFNRAGPAATIVSLEQISLAAYIASDAAEGRNIGFIDFHSPNPRDRFCWFHAVFDRETTTSFASESLTAAVADVLSRHPFHKLYYETTDPRLGLPAGAVLEATLQRHAFVANQYCDLSLFSVLGAPA
jgi:RimJ/RimL family protein N-acetyltransferase